MPFSVRIVVWSRNKREMLFQLNDFQTFDNPKVGFFSVAQFGNNKTVKWGLGLINNEVKAQPRFLLPLR